VDGIGDRVVAVVPAAGDPVVGPGEVPACRRCRPFSKDITDMSSKEDGALISYKSSENRQRDNC